MRVWKYIWVVGLTILLAGIAVYAGVHDTAGRSSEQALMFDVLAADGTRQSIECWQDESTDYVFLPSYANLADLEVHLDGISAVMLDGNRLENGDTCGAYVTDVIYQLDINGLTRSLMFVQSANVAAMYVETATGSMQYINQDKDYKEEVHIALYTEEGELDYSSIQADTMSGRGNSTWGCDKKPYNLKLSEDKSLLEMGEAQNWALIANYFDPTNLRNKLIYDFVWELGSDLSAPECQFIDLYLNGEYNGLYLLCQRVDSGAERGRSSEGSYLFSFEFASRTEDMSVFFLLDEGIAVEIKQPKPCSDEEALALQWHLLEMEKAILSVKGINEETGITWRNYIDIDTWVRKYLVEEIFENRDAGAGSQYFSWHPSSDSNKVFAGPVWDYDMTLGVGQNNPRCFLAIRECKDAEVYTLWYRALYQKKEFYDCVVEVYQNEYLPLLEDLMDVRIDEAADEISQAAKMNQLRWKASTFSDSVDDMKIFLRERVDFLNSAWIDGVDYCSVCIDPGDADYRYYAVKRGETIERIPTPRELGINDSEVWNIRGDDRPFDPNQPVEKDMVLYTSVSTTYYVIFPPLALLTLLPVLVAIDFVLRRRDRRRPKE